MIDITECPICNSTAFENAFHCKDSSISQESFQLIRCCHCHFLITSPRPDSTQLSKYYSSEEYISHSDTAKGIINKLYHIVRKITLHNKVALIQRYFKKPSLLDIGSGAGYFLNICMQHGFQITGIEPDLNSRSRSIDQFKIDVREEEALDQLTASGFDVITLWHVLEHVENLNKRLQQISRLLKPDGIVIIALPNCSSNDAMHYKAFWAGYDVPRHLWHFTPETIRKLGFKNEFEIFQILPMYYDAYYVSMLSEKYMQSKFGVFFGFIRGFISNMAARWKNDNSYSSQIYLLRKKKSHYSN